MLYLLIYHKIFLELVNFFAAVSETCSYNTNKKQASSQGADLLFIYACHSGIFIISDHFDAPHPFIVYFDRCLVTLRVDQFLQPAAENAAQLQQ